MTGGDAAGTGVSGGFNLLAGNNFFGSGAGGAFYMQSGYSGTGVGGDFRVGVASGSAGSGSLYFGTDSNTDCFSITESAGVSKMGFFNVAPVVKPVVTGSRASGAALQDLLTKLASLGLITDSTTL
jgi:hypothetical protein